MSKISFMLLFSLFILMGCQREYQYNIKFMAEVEGAEYPGLYSVRHNLEDEGKAEKIEPVGMPYEYSFSGDVGGRDGKLFFSIRSYTGGTVKGRIMVNGLVKESGQAVSTDSTFISLVLRHNLYD